jgi:hypothetical protein
MFKKYSEKVKVENAIKQSSSTRSSKEEEDEDENEDEDEDDAKMYSLFVGNKGPNRDEEIFKILDLFFKHHSKMPLELPKDQKCGSLLHYFALSDARVIKKLVSKPYDYSPDLENEAGYTPLLVALNSGHNKETILQLLECNVNVNKMDPITKLTPLQLCFKNNSYWCRRREQVIGKLLEKGIYF